MLLLLMMMPMVLVARLECAMHPHHSEKNQSTARGVKHESELQPQTLHQIKTVNPFIPGQRSRLTCCSAT